MTPADIRSGVAELLSIILGRSVNPDEHVQRRSEAKWDSLKHVELVLMTEEKFDIRLTEAEMGAIASSADLWRLVEQKHAT